MSKFFGKKVSINCVSMLFISDEQATFSPKNPKNKSGCHNLWSDSHSLLAATLD